MKHLDVDRETRLDTWGGMRAVGSGQHRRHRGKGWFKGHRKHGYIIEDIVELNTSHDQGGPQKDIFLGREMTMIPVRYVYYIYSTGGWQGHRSYNMDQLVNRAPGSDPEIQLSVRQKD